jgi:hypothetical protein
LPTISNYICGLKTFLQKIRFEMCSLHKSDKTLL